MAFFKQFNLDDKLLLALEKNGYVKLSPVQEKVIPLALKGESLLARSETGSGKTHAFLVPILSRLDVEKNEIQAIIIAPTRELARQIYDFAMEINNDYKNAKILLLTASRDKERTSQKLAQNPHLIITTPGQLLELGIENSVTTLRTVKTLVLDEADMLMDQGFYPLINEILLHLDNPQIMIFSATIPKTLNKILEQYVGKSHVIEISRPYQTSEGVSHHLIDVRHQNRNEIVEQFIKWRNPYLLLIFASTTKTVDALYKFLSNRGYNVGIIHGDLQKRERKQMIRRIRNNEFQIIVASDIAARGIDIPDISDVLQYDFPNDLTFYFHRAGRTARFDKVGDSFAFYDADSEHIAVKLEELGVNFDYFVYKGGTFKEVDQRPKKQKPKSKSAQELDHKIRMTRSKYKNAKVKPGYKKKIEQEVDKVKRQHKRQIIKEDIKRQKQERYRKEKKK